MNSICDVKEYYETPDYWRQELIVHNDIEWMQQGAKEVLTSQ
jgi:hypothetical protein